MLDPTIAKPSARVRQRLLEKQARQPRSQNAEAQYNFSSGVQQDSYYCNLNQIQQNAEYQPWFNYGLQNQEQFRPGPENIIQEQFRRSQEWVDTPCTGSVSSI